LQDYRELRSVVRARIIDWRRDMERRELGPATIRRKLSALSSLFDYLCDRNAVVGNPVDGVKQPMAIGNEGTTPALGDRQARKLLEAPPADTTRVFAIARSWQPCSITASAGRSSAGSGSRTCTAARASCISASKASAPRPDLNT
jgi:integrase